MLDQIHNELERIGAKSTRVSLDREFEPEAGELLKVVIGQAYWHLPPLEFLNLLTSITAGAGSEAVKAAIERDGLHVWHGPAPEGSRETPHV